MAPRPPQVVYDAFVAPTSRITRRVEIYEKDGLTPWRPEHWKRLVGGNVSVDYGRDDRRNAEITLDNWDGVFDHGPYGLWYDKVYKLFYGVDVNEKLAPPNIVIVEEYNCPGEALNLKKRLADAGFYNVRVKVQATAYAEVAGFDVVISLSGDYPRKIALLNDAYNNGKAVFTASPSATKTQLPLHIDAVGTVTAAVDVRVSPSTLQAHPVNSGWTAFTIPALVRTPIVSDPTTASAPAAATATDLQLITAQAAKGNRWAHFITSKFGDTGRGDNSMYTQMVGRLFSWLTERTAIEYWECQIGEFLADSLNDDGDDLMQISCRDYTKRCLDSKLVAATMFLKSEKLEDTIRTLALNSGISKFNLPVTGKTIGKDTTYEADTERWKIMKEFATASGYELFFDGTGTLVLREMRDPYLTPPELVLSIGPGGNLIKEGRKASDTSLKNHIVVAGESNDSTVPPVYAEAKNTVVGSASNIATLGDKVQRYTSSLVTTVAQAQELANQYLRVASLEEFELNFTSIMFPWLEAGDILENTKPRRGTDMYAPTRYLLSSIAFPLDLGAMTGSGKRVTIVL